MCECSYSIPVRKITFWIFGGVAAIEDDVQTPGAEFFIAVVGPLTSAALRSGHTLSFLLRSHLSHLTYSIHPPS